MASTVCAASASAARLNNPVPVFGRISGSRVPVSTDLKTCSVPFFLSMKTQKQPVRKKRMQSIS